MNPVLSLRLRLGLTQDQLADLGGVAPTSISGYELGKVSPKIRTVTELAEAAGLEVHACFTPPMAREDRLRLRQHEAMAVRMRQEPAVVLHAARQNLITMRADQPHDRQRFDHWEVLLDLPVTDLFDAMTCPSPWAQDLRRVTPFTGVLTERERAEIERRLDAEEAADTR